MKKVLILLVACYIILLGVPFVIHAQSLQYGSDCTSNAQCISQLCDPVPAGDGTRTCLCTQSSHCPFNYPNCNTSTNGCWACSANSDCSDTHYCFTILGSCQNCTSDGNCDNGLVCTNGVCVSSGNPVLGEYGDYCSANSQCQSGLCRDLSCRCVTNNDCLWDTTCSNGECVRAAVTGNHYCWVVVSGDTEYSWDYDSETECRSQCQSFDCRALYGNNCTGSCCNNQNINAQNVTCSGSTGPVSTGGSSQIPNPLKCGDVECVVQMIADFIAGLVTVIGTIMIIFGGIQYITSAGSEDKARRAKNTVLYAVIGIAIAVSVDFIIGFLGEVLGRGGN